ncbi:MAG: tyrosine-protein phosphatase [Clostridia bacterium]|nr:tyrosine-protein phosphatase [Clostridia bacterium]
MIRHYNLKNVSNFRDLGGFMTESGNVTKYNKVFRSSAIYDLTDEERELLHKKGIKKVIDLRVQHELERKPSAFLTDDEIEYINIPLSDKWTNNADEVPNLYFDIVKDHASMARVLKVIANTDEPLVFHCSAGKDRTGIISGILLSLNGVKEEDILADYISSYAYIYKEFRILKATVPEFKDFVGTMNVETLEITLKRIKEVYGSMEGYLKEIGLSDEEIVKLKNKLI